MIIFLNFAPFEFFGGAEKWMIDVSTFMNKKEPVALVSVSSIIGNIYSRLVLKRNFDLRSTIDKKGYSKKISLDLQSFLPFSSKWHQARKTFREARIVYLKYEVQELSIAIYFGGFGVLKKTIAGIHTPFVYPLPITQFDKLHNFIYKSALSRMALSKMHHVHVITKRDEKLMRQVFNLLNVTYVPNFAESPKKYFDVDNKDKKTLNIIFLGELNLRKGVDILLSVISEAPDHFYFNIVGNGPMKDDVIEVQKIRNNLTYHGYLNKSEIIKLFKANDVLFLPSRAEGFSLAILEAMSFGLTIVDSEYIELDLPGYVEFSVKSTPLKYIQIFEKIYSFKQQGKLFDNRSKISSYFNQNYSPKIILPKLGQLFL